MVRTSRQARNRQRSNFLIATLALLIVISVLAGVLWWAMNPKSTVNVDNLCPQQGPLGHQIVLIDTTDPLNDTQKAAIDLSLTRLIEKQTPPGFLISVFVLSDNFKADSKPFIELCNPGDEQGHSKLTENLRQIQLRYQDRFLQPLFEQTKKQLNGEPAQTSPILEMLQMVSLNSIERQNVQGPRNLIIFSDLLHNNKSLSMYRDVPDYDEFSKSDYARKTKISFKNVDVEVWLLQNSSGEKQKRLIDFWQKYFIQNEALNFKLNRLPG